jgi:hypothetical protein
MTIELQVRYVIHNPLLRVFVKPADKVLVVSATTCVPEDPTGTWGVLRRDMNPTVNSRKRD